MIFDLETHTVETIHEKDAWRICDFVVSNADRLKRYFPITLKLNLNPTLSSNFVSIKTKEFIAKKEFLFTLKEKENRRIIGLLYLKELNWENKQGELAYAIGYTHENMGLTSNTVQYISNWAFEVLELKTLQIITHKTNLPSVTVAKKCGFIWKKTLPKAHKPPNEEPLDMELYELYHER